MNLMKVTMIDAKHCSAYKWQYKCVGPTAQFAVR